MAFGRGVVRPDNMLPGPAPEVQSLRQHRQWWAAEIERRDALDVADTVRMSATSLTEWYDEMRDIERAVDGPRRTVFHRRVRIRQADGTVRGAWRMPYMRPSGDLLVLWPGRLESRVSEAAFALAQRHAAIQAESTWGRALFRARLLGYGFPAEVVGKALALASTGVHVEVDTKAYDMAGRSFPGRTLLVDGEVFARDRTAEWGRLVAAGLAERAFAHEG